MEKSIWNDDMKLLTITTWNNKLYKEYAHRFEATYNWTWPYTVYNEDDGMYDAIPDLKSFVERNKHRPAKDFLQDAVRFSYKVYGYCHAIQQYSECGFLGFNMKHPEIQNYAKEMIRMYNSDDIYKLIECHDSFIWDHVRVKFELEKGVKNNNIGDHKKAHVQARSVLGMYYDHTKGPSRKNAGFSGENQMVIREGRR